MSEGRLLAALPEPLVVQTLQGLEPGPLARLLAGLDEAETRAPTSRFAGDRTAPEVRSVLAIPSRTAPAP